MSILSLFISSSTLCQYSLTRSLLHLFFYFLASPNEEPKTVDDFITDMNSRDEELFTDPEPETVDDFIADMNSRGEQLLPPPQITDMNSRDEELFTDPEPETVDDFIADMNSRGEQLLPPPRYPNMRATNLKVNRYKPAKKKPEPNIPFHVDVGDVVYYVTTETYYRRRIRLEQLEEEGMAARVVGESCFAVGSPHVRLLQLQCLKTGEQWYEPETKFSKGHLY